MNLKEIKDMINLMNENGLVELEMERNGLKIRLKKSGGISDESVSGERVVVERLNGEKQEVVLESAQSSNRIEIKSPMVGTFYRASSPDVSSFTDVGEEIEAGDVVCIIEAMKLMNEIKSETAGKVVEVLVENGEAVEFGQALFVVETG